MPEWGKTGVINRGELTKLVCMESLSLVRIFIGVGNIEKKKEAN